MKREPDDFARQIARYNQELLQASRRSSFPAPPPTDSAPEPPPRPMPTPPAPEPPLRPMPTPPAPEPPRNGEGYLQVQVFTAREATPLAGAHIHIYEHADGGDRLLDSDFSDDSGLSRVFTLPGVDPALSLTPGNPKPFVSYAVQVDYPGYYRIRSEKVPVFSSVLSRQPVFMVPLPEQETGESTEILYPNADTDGPNTPKGGV